MDSSQRAPQTNEKFFFKLFPENRKYSNEHSSNSEA